MPLQRQFHTVLLGGLVAMGFSGLPAFQTSTAFEIDTEEVGFDGPESIQSEPIESGLIQTEPAPSAPESHAILPSGQELRAVPPPSRTEDLRTGRAHGLETSSARAPTASRRPPGRASLRQITIPLYDLLSTYRS